MNAPGAVRSCGTACGLLLVIGFLGACDASTYRDYCQLRVDCEGEDMATCVEGLEATSEVRGDCRDEWIAFIECASVHGWCTVDDRFHPGYECDVLRTSMMQCRDGRSGGAEPVEAPRH